MLHGPRASFNPSAIVQTREPRHLSAIQADTCELAVLQEALPDTLKVYTDKLDIAALAQTAGLWRARDSHPTTRFAEFTRYYGDSVGALADDIRRTLSMPKGEGFDQLVDRLHRHGEYFANASDADVYALSLVFSTQTGKPKYHRDLNFYYRGSEELLGKGTVFLIPGTRLAAYPREHDMRSAARPDLVHCASTLERGELGIFKGIPSGLGVVEHTTPVSARPRLTALYGKVDYSCFGMV